MKDWLPLLTAALGLVTVSIGWKIMTDLKAIHLEINSRLTQLLTLTADSSRAEGIEQERLRGNSDAASKP